MRTAKIDETLKNILEIDRLGEEKQVEKEALHDKYDAELTQKKRSIEREYMKTARLKTKEKREKIYNALEREVATIHSQTNVEIQRLNFILENNIESITGEIFNKILKNI
jgi:hypothetical protein